MTETLNKIEELKLELDHLEAEEFEAHIKLIKENSHLHVRNELLTKCIKWMMENYKATLSNKPVKNLDELFTYAESLINQDEELEKEN